MHIPAPDHASTEAFLPATCCDDIRSLVRYWRTIHPASGLPSRRHVDPTDIPNLLPYVWMTDVFRDPWRFRFRLIGTAIVAFTGHDSTGRWCDEVYPYFQSSEAYRCMRDCAAAGQPRYRTGKLLSNPDRIYRHAQRVYLPLAVDGITTDIILALTRYLPAGRA